MKKNEKRKLWKQGLGTALVCGLAVAVFPAAKADASRLAESRSDQHDSRACNTEPAVCRGNSGKSVFPYPGIYRYAEGKSSGSSGCEIFYNR